MDLRSAIPLIILCLFLLLVFIVVRTSVFGNVEPQKHIYFEIVFLLLLAVIGELAVSYLKLPSVTVLLVLGILMSNSFLSIAWSSLQGAGLPLPQQPPDVLRLVDLISFFAQLGAVILLFKIGLHSRIDRIFSTENLLVASAGVVLPFAVGYIYASASGGSFAYSMFLAAALTATSIGVTVALLKEYGLIGKRFAQVIIGAAVIDDVLGLLVLSFVINVGAGTSLAPVMWTAISAGIFILGGILAGRYFVQYLDSKDMSARRMMIVLAFMLFYAYVAEFINLSAIVGAFVSGIILNRSRHIDKIEEDTFGLELLFMPIFFISLGMLVDVNALALFAVPIIILTVLAALSKIISCAGASLLAKLPQKDALAVGVGMIPRGEVALIVASIGLSTRVISSSEYSIISAMALLTTLIAPPLLSMILKKRS